MGGNEEEFKKHIIRGICNGVNHLHQNKVIHRDINPSNILLKNEGRVYPSVKIADFNVYTIHDGKECELTHTLDIGQPHYRAKEVRESISKRAGGKERAKYGCSVDVWSIGTIVYEMSTGQVFNQLTDREIWANNFFSIEQKIGNEIKGDHTLTDFLFKILWWDASRRARCSDLLTHRYLAQGSMTAQDCKLGHTTLLGAIKEEKPEDLTSGGLDVSQV